MCGIVGFMGPPGATLEPLIKRMTDAISNRGPDGSGCWSRADLGLGFGHRRLSIIDLSTDGAQPMRSRSGRFTLVYNGEVYNFPTLRKELAGLGHQFTGRSDTEVLLAAFEQWGVDDSLLRFNGMFALAVFDENERRVTLVRDRIGIKPLYYGWAGRSFVFGSELKALRRHPEYTGDICREALSLFIQYSYVPAPVSINKGIFKLPPGSLLKITFRDGSWNAGEPEPYWTLAEAAERGIKGPFRGDEVEALDELNRLGREAVARQMVSDVPIGAFLSGGIDSSLVASLMQEASSVPIRTFTIGFTEKSWNEADYAAAVASHLGTSHNQVILSGTDCQAIAVKLAGCFDEPFADPSAIPTWLVSDLARRSVTVCLSGDGGDELFGGYNRYLWVGRLWKAFSLLPRSLKTRLPGLAAMLPGNSIDFLFSRLLAGLTGRIKLNAASEKLFKLANLSGIETEHEFYLAVKSRCAAPEAYVLGTSGSHGCQAGSLPASLLLNTTERMMFCDAGDYLPDDVLTKLDRASMAVSLESRVPLLDNNLIEFAWSLPLDMKIRGGVSKILLRKLLGRYIPDRLIDRPKMGFGMPVGEWLRGPLRGWADGLINDDTIVRQGYLNADTIRARWNEHLSCRRDWQSLLWNVLMFQSWLSAQQAGREI